MTGPLTEPIPTAWLLAGAGILLALSVVVSRLSRRTRVPAVLVFLLIGMLAGSEGPGRLIFEDYALTFRLGSAALAMILFDGGLNTSWRTLRNVLVPAGLLATLGVLITAALVAVGARLLGIGWSAAMLLGAVVASTDAAAVFSVLRGSGVAVRRRIAATLEVESGFNDPLAVVLTIAVTGIAAGTSRSIGGAIGDALLQLAIGGGLGILIGLGGRRILARINLRSDGLYPVLTLATAMIAFGLPTLLHGSGFLAVYLAGMVIGNGQAPHRADLVRVHDFLAWASQIIMFLTLGLLVLPSRLFAVAPIGLAIALWLIFIARPVAVAVCLAPFGYTWREIVYVGWVGLRGAVPIILATYPVLVGLDGAQAIFNIVFFVVVVSVLLQGTTARWVTHRLGLAETSVPPPAAMLEIVSRQKLSGELISYFIRPEAAVAGIAADEIPLPEGAAIVLVVRGPHLLPAKGLVIEPGDHVHLLAPRGAKSEIALMFGQREEG